MSASSLSYSENSADDNTSLAKVAKCIRRVANISASKPTMLMDTKVFNANLLQQVLPRGAPKVIKLFEKIEELDAKDMRIDKRHYKHMIFTDIDSSNYGAKLLASAFVAKGFTPAFTSNLALKSVDVLEKTKGNNFGLLLSKTFGKKAMSVKLKKAQMSLFNSRPENIFGDHIRFVILDQGFKEGIDLFDVKYVHLFEPLVSRADEKQAIGRSTRFCGQKGLQFHPRFGWPLYVFRYDVKLNHEMQGARTMFELFLKYSDIDMRRVVFAAELEKATVDAAVDTKLTEEIHSFKIDDPPPILTPKVGGVTTRRQARGPAPPPSILGDRDMKTYVQQYFMQHKYPHVKLENMCEDKPTEGHATKGRNIVSFTPTQEFVRHFFQPSSPYKGLLLFHSVGSGKTCSAIATATTSFEKEGFSILWVTRHTLKSDIWKNMYDQICSIDIKERLETGNLKLPAKIEGPMKYVSKQWIEPISYKQFSNMLLKQNKYYEEIVNRNGAKDPLRKTLVIIDEAHKLYAPNVAGSEKPQTEILENMIQNSYKLSGKDSVRVLLMTATPYTEDGTEMLKLLNLIRPSSKAFPTDFDSFASKYLDDEGYFTSSGLKKFKDNISGYVSYINRSQDARNFAHPVIENVYVNMSLSGKDPPARHNDKKLKELAETIKELRAKLKEETMAIKETIKETRVQCQADAKERMNKCKTDAKEFYDEGVDGARMARDVAKEDCKKLPMKERKPCKDEADVDYKTAMDDLKRAKAEALEKCKDLKAVCAQDKESRLAEVQKKAAELKELVAKEKLEKEKIKGTIGEFRSENKASLVALKPLRAEAKKVREERKGINANIKEIKDEIKAEKDVAKVTELRKELAPLVTKKKELDKVLEGLRIEITNHVSSKKLKQIDFGRAVIGDVSQETALLNKCLKSGEDDE